MASEMLNCIRPVILFCLPELGSRKGLGVIAITMDCQQSYHNIGAIIVDLL